MTKKQCGDESHSGKAYCPICGKKRCSRCGKWKPRNALYFRPHKPNVSYNADGFDGWCWDCEHEDQLIKKGWMLSDGTPFGLAQRQQMDEEQKHRCLICGTLDKLVTDHNRANNIVRGRVCSRCNTGLIHIIDDLGPEDARKLLDKTTIYQAKGMPQYNIKDKRLRLPDGTLFTKEHKSKMFSDQRGHCIICEKLRPLCTEHNHLTHVVRGLACHACNTGIIAIVDGYGEKRARELMEKAIHYVETRGWPA